jgi:hypothetical protein
MSLCPQALCLLPLSFKPKSKPRHHHTTKSTNEVICIGSSGDETDDAVLHQQQITASDADHDPESVYLGECVVLSYTAVVVLICLLTSTFSASIQDFLILTISKTATKSSKGVGVPKCNELDDNGEETL